MKTRFLKSTQLLVLALSFSTLASAKDAIKASVAPLGSPTPILQVNGNPYSAGTYAVGTIQLFYTVNAYQFTAGDFASFRLDMQDINMGANPATSYPVTLNLTQTGSANLVLTPVPASFSVTGVGWTGSSTVTISIPSFVPSTPSLNVDGTDLVGNLQLVTSPQGAHLDTVTTVQVHIKLVHPTACLRVFDFITDEEFNAILTSTVVNVNNKGKVNSTIPGQFSDNILVANTCSTSQSFDLLIGLDSSFDTNPHGNPGNATFTYLKTGYVDPSSFSISAFGSGTPQGERLCLASIVVPGGDTFLATVHMGIIRGMLASALPSSGTFTFRAELDVAGSTSGCTNPSAGALNSMATPNPASATLTFTTQ